MTKHTDSSRSIDSGVSGNRFSSAPTPPGLTRLSGEQTEERTAREIRMKEKIEQIMSEFDFEKVAKAMASVNWTWWDTAPQTPSVDRLRSTARSLLEGCVRGDEPTHSISTGGFYARKENGELSLDFCMAYATTVND